jgi:iron(III) transport system ATP-binding protein
VLETETCAAILELDRVVRRFDTWSIPAINGVSLTLAQGELLALLGPSGCGKTTLLRTIAGLEIPDAGRVTLAGQVVAGAGVPSVPPERRKLGMVFQDYALFPHLTVQQNVAFGLTKLRKRAPAIARERVIESLELVGLTGLERRYPHELSGGQQQRVALARALAPKPTLVLLDEPLSNLDAQVRRRLRQDIRQILKAAGASGVLVTHDREEAMAIADRVAVMREGHIEQLDRPEVLYWQPASRFVASFVAQVNFLPAWRRGDGWMTEAGPYLGEVVQPDQPTADGAESGEFCLRQDDCELVPDGDGGAIILDRQFLGREYGYTVRLESGRLLQVTTGIDTAIAPQTPVQLKIVAPRLQWFPVVYPEGSAIAAPPIEMATHP